MIEIQHLYKNFGKQEVLKNLTLDIHTPGIYAILGPNGSGKTTLIKSILGMVHYDKGSITVHGKSIAKDAHYRENIDYLPQIANFPQNLRVAELIAMIKDIRDKSADEKPLLEYFNLKSHLNKKLNNLSGGTKQKVNIVLCFMFDSPLMILDEPTSGLDPIALLRLKDLLMKAKKENKIIVLTSHIIDFVETMADEIIFLLEGKIYFKGGLQQLTEKTGKSNLENAIAHLLKEQYD